MDIFILHPKFLRYLALEEGLSPKTISCMESTMKTFLRRTDCVNLADMTLENMRGFFYEGVERHKWSQSTFANHHKYLKRFLGWCVEKEYIKENPIIQIKRPKRPRPLPRRLTGEEGCKLLYTAFTMDWRYGFECTRNHSIISTFLFAGIRANELLTLEITDLNLTTGNILIRSGKGNKDRNVPIHFKLARTLKGYMAERKGRGIKSRYLFPSIRGEKALTYKNLLTICRRIGKEADIYFSPHQLRHTFGSVAVEQGMDVVKLKDIMGHSSIISTMIYLRMSSKSLKEGLDKLELF